jgi:PAS domain S-box-containing protein
MPCLVKRSYPRAVTTPTRSPRARRPAAAATPAAAAPDAQPARRPRARRDPDGGAGGIHDLLTAAVDEAARLLDADGAMVYLVDPDTGHLRFAHDAGIRSRASRARVRSIDLPLGVGMFGRAVAERNVVLTRDYLADESFPHAPDTDLVVSDIGIRSMVVAPLVAGDAVFGALGTFSKREDAFSPAHIALVRALADHAAASMSNARLIEALAASRSELADRADIERSLREIAARISAATDLPAVLQLGVDEAVRLLRADGARIDLIEGSSGLLRWAYASGALHPDESVWPQDPDETLEQGISGQAVVTGRAYWTGDYVKDRRFPHGHGSDTYVEASGIRSVMSAPLTGESGPFGALTIFCGQVDAWDETGAGLLEAIASQAAIAITNARLIEELARSRGELARTADAERTLREIAGRVSAMRDQDEILQSVIDASVRLLGAAGAMIDLLGASGMAEAWTSHEAGQRAESNLDLLNEVSLEPDAGVSGRAVRTRQVEWTGAYLEDERFQHTPARDAFVRESGIRSVIAAPLVHRDVVVGAITVYGDRADAFGEADAGLLGALADQAAVAIANARLIEELERSRAEVARRADSERTLREIAARVSAILEPDEVLQQIVDETTRLLESDGARIDLYVPELDALRWSYAAGDAMRVVPEWAKTGGLKPGQAVAGTAFAEQRTARTDDYLTDERFARDDMARAWVKQSGIRSVIAVPLAGDAGPLGTLSVVSRRQAAYDDADAEILSAFATQASVAIRNARLIEELARSRGVIERRAEAEQALREIAARITAIRAPGDLLQHVVDEARRLLRADGAVIDQFNAETQRLEWAYDAGLPEDQRASVRASSLRLGEGLSGTAVQQGRVMTAGDYLSGEFPHDEVADSGAAAAGIGDLIVAPIIGESGPLGAIEVFSHRVHAFDAIDEAVLGGLADQAAIAFTNARLIEALEQSQAAVAKRADTERALRDITARIAALREPDVILDRVVEEAMRLLGTDGAHLTRMSDDGTYLVPMVVAGGSDPDTQAWLLSKRFPIGGGINGLAAERGEPVWTSDYVLDPRIPHDADDQATAERLGLCGMAAAPLRAPGGEVIGTLAISSARPRSFDPEELDLLQGLADQAAIAITNTSLLSRLTESEERYRYLVENAPDLVWSIGADTRLTFVSDAVERLTGYPADELIGRHFGALVHDSSQDVAGFDWATGMAAGSQEIRGRVNLRSRAGPPISAEFIAIARLDEAGRFIGANGSVRDMRERDRLERELRDSEIRYRTLASSSPDLVFATDAAGHYTFLSDQASALLGWDLEASIGRHFMEYVAPGWEAAAAASYEAIVGQPNIVHTARIDFRHGEGRTVPLEINIVGSMEDGVLSAIHGVARDVSERERLERELHASQDRYRFLVENSPDAVFSTDADGLFTFMSEAMERMTGYRPDELVGGHFGRVVEEASIPETMNRWAALMEQPSVEQVTQINLRGPDGRLVPVEVSAIGMVDSEGRFAGIHGATRDISERDRLERELRESEERYRYLVASSPDLVWLTDAAGTLTFISDAARTMLGKEPTELMGRPYADIFAPSARRDASIRYRWLARHPSAVHRMRLPFRHADGHDVLVEINGTGMTDEGRFIGAHGAARDVSERDRLERDLRRQAGELAAGEERAHLARELHDSVTQALFSMTLVSRSVELLLDRDAVAAKTQLGQLRDLQREALAEMRALIFELRPGNLEQDGLTRALRTHTAALQGRIGLPILVESTLDERLPLEIEEVLYRISQEALHNVVKHASARQVRLEVGRTATGVRLQIQDDGKGFDPTRVPDGHLGLAGMRARADKIGARFTCRSVPGQGTTIEVAVPDAAIAAGGAAPALAGAASIRDA